MGLKRKAYPFFTKESCILWICIFNSEGRVKQLHDGKIYVMYACYSKQFKDQNGFLCILKPVCSCTL